MNAALPTVDRPGFADGVAEAQAAFRAVLDALARPGSLHAAGGGLLPPPPLAPAAAAVLLTLLDADTPVALAPSFGPCRDWIAFHCGAPVVAAGRAAFLLADALPELSALPAGSDEAPQDGATVLLQVAALGTGTAYRLDGPGLRETAILRVAGLPEDFADAWARNRALFPRGVDLVLCAGGRLAALPRSVTVAAMEGAALPAPGGAIGATPEGVIGTAPVGGLGTAPRDTIGTAPGGGLGAAPTGAIGTVPRGTLGREG